MHRFHGKLAAIRRNFKILKLFQTRNKSVRGQPVTSHKVKKFILAPEARHPDFDNRFYSHLQFRESKYLYVSASFQITDSSGLLFFNGGKNGTSYISAQLVKGTIRLCLNCGQKPVCHDGFTISSGNWYLVSVSAQGSEGEVRLNEGDAIQVNCPADQSYIPRPSMYVGGGGPKDWRVLKRLVAGAIFFSGMIDTLSLNGWPVTYKMATLVGQDEEINSLGYSFSDMVTELRIPYNTMAKLKCGVPQKSRISHVVRVVWFYNMKRLLPRPGTDIEDTESPYQSVSQVNLHPGQHSDGIYACVLSEDGVLSVRHVFVLLRYTRISAREKEGRDEWIGFFFLMIFLALAIIALCCYICQDQPRWKVIRDNIERVSRASLKPLKPFMRIKSARSRRMKNIQTDEETEISSILAEETSGRAKRNKTVKSRGKKKPASKKRGAGPESDVLSVEGGASSSITDFASSSTTEKSKKGRRRKPRTARNKKHPTSDIISVDSAEPMISELSSDVEAPTSSQIKTKSKKMSKRKDKFQNQLGPDSKPDTGSQPGTQSETESWQPHEAAPKVSKGKFGAKQEKVKFSEGGRKTQATKSSKPGKALGGGDETSLTELQEDKTLGGCRNPKTYAELMNIRMPPQRNTPGENWPTQSFNVPLPCPELQPLSAKMDGFIQPVDILCNPYFVQGSAHEHPCMPCPGVDEFQRREQCLQMCGNNFVLAMNYQKNNSNNYEVACARPASTDDNINVANSCFKDNRIKASPSSPDEKTTKLASNVWGLQGASFEASNTTLTRTFSGLEGRINQLSTATPNTKTDVSNDENSANVMHTDAHNRDLTDTLSINKEWDNFTLFRQKSMTDKKLEATEYGYKG
ncbi:hemicentin-1 [Elysia marginata]|uniref:Hemicentin-1 n=1 Tax=Elysia marginata TaxID=1093978 RepID=A0AAV4GYJ7_9GAST|nr:hemicentin-1 [Elysia marginata]